MPRQAPTGPVEELYNNGVDALNARRFSTAGDQFSAVEQNYPYSTWAVNAQLMSGYSQYLQNKYTDAIGTLDRFIQLHPAHRDIAYAYYLRALCYYEQIADIQRDQKGTEQAMNALREVVNRFPDTTYARDAKLKIDLCFDHLAGKEMEIGRFYQKQHLYEAAIGRFQRVVDDYPDHQPCAGGAGAPDRGLPRAWAEGSGAQDRRCAGLQLSRQRLVRRQLRPASGRWHRPPQRQGTERSAQNSAASSPVPGMRCSNRTLLSSCEQRGVLTALSIRDVVLIERLDLAFDHGLTVLTGETGAGKSILLDSLGLALGARAESGLVRASAEQASVTACFSPPNDHAVRAVLDEHGLTADDEIVLRRDRHQGRPLARLRQRPSGRRRPVAAHRRAAGRGARPARANEPGRPRQPCRSAGCVRGARRHCALPWQTPGAPGGTRCTRLEQAREAIAAAERDEEWLRHAVDELATLAPRIGEEETLAQERQRLQQNERRAEAIAAALAELTPRDRRSAGPGGFAARGRPESLQRLAPVRPDRAAGRQPGRSGAGRAGTGGGSAGRGGNAADAA